MPVNSNNLLGVMQGRLLPKYKNRFQAHPIGYWKEEFHLAKNLGIDCIEFILDFNDLNKNPLMTKKGVLEIKAISEETGVAVKTICADYFMEAPLHSIDNAVSKVSFDILTKLIENTDILEIDDIVIPCVDISSLSDNDSINRFIKVIKKAIPLLELKEINLSLETDLSPPKFCSLLNQIPSSRVKVNYDIGNSASLGFDPEEELNAYGEKISDIHIKDRNLGSGSVPLGDGCADFDKFFIKLKDINYTGPFIMQAFRDDEGVEIFKEQFLWIQKKMKEVYES